MPTSGRTAMLRECVTSGEETQNVLFQDIEDRVSQDMQDRCGLALPAWLSR
jgi:hypothetical protein